MAKPRSAGACWPIGQHTVTQLERRTDIQVVTHVTERL